MGLSHLQTCQNTFLRNNLVLMTEYKQFPLKTAALLYFLNIVSYQSHVCHLTLISCFPFLKTMCTK